MLSAREPSLERRAGSEILDNFQIERNQKQTLSKAIHLSRTAKPLFEMF